MVFGGEFEPNIDEKGRIIIPAKLRTAIEGDTLKMTKGFDKCLMLFPVDEWKRVSEQIRFSTSIFQEKGRAMRRRFVDHDLEIDKTGRIIIPPTLRDFAELKKECVFLGFDNYIEIWSKEVYQEYGEENEPGFKNFAEEIGQILTDSKKEVQD